MFSQLHQSPIMQELSLGKTKPFFQNLKSSNYEFAMQSMTIGT